jgi:hypothetical protein
MSRFEDVLLERMTVRRWLAAIVAVAVAFGVAGWFGGRAYMRSQFDSAFREAMADSIRKAGIPAAVAVPAMARAEGQMSQLDDWMKVRKQLEAEGKTEAEISAARDKHIAEWAKRKADAAKATK